MIAAVVFAILADRVELGRDMDSTQDRGIATPIDRICPDRQRGR